MKNLPLSDPMSEAEARKRKDISRRVIPFADVKIDSVRLLSHAHGIAFFECVWWPGLVRAVKCRWRPGDVVYFGETLVKSDDGVPLVQYRRDMAYCVERESKDTMEWGWKNKTLASRFCPARCARRYGRIVSAEPRRLHEISVNDARREGVQPSAVDQATNIPHLHAFMTLWDAINAERGFPWRKNPWVWRIEWDRLKPDDALLIEATAPEHRPPVRASAAPA